VFQVAGIMGLLRTYRQTIGWAWHLFRGPIEREFQSPASRIPMRAPDGGPAAHALPGTRLSTIEPAAQPTVSVIKITKAA
jgi:hypothetical protein